MQHPHHLKHKWTKCSCITFADVDSVLQQMLCMTAITRLLLWTTIPLIPTTTSPYCREREKDKLWVKSSSCLTGVGDL